MPFTRRTIVCVSALLSLPAVFFWRATWGVMTLGQRDVVSTLFPLQHFAFAQWRSGAWPLWNPYGYGGMPLLAQMQAGVLDPLNAFYLLSVTGRTLTFTQEAAFAVALTGMFAFTRSLGLKRRACCIAAVIYGLSGFPVARSIYGALLHALAWLPWWLWAVERLRQSERWRYVAWGALFVAWQSVTGHPQIFTYSALLVGSYVGWRGGRKWRFIGQSLLLMALGCLTAAVQWLPAWEMTRASVRQGADYEFYVSNSPPPLTLLTTLLPFFHGGGSAPYRLPYWGDAWSHNEAQFYVGVLALALAGGATLKLWREPTGQVKFWSVVALVALSCTLGGYVPPLAAVLAQLPVLGSFRSPNRHWMEVLCVLAVLSGCAVNAVLDEGAAALRRAVLRGALALTGLCAVIAAGVLGWPARAETWLTAWPGWRALPPGFLQAAGAEFFVPALVAATTTAALWIFLRQPTSHWRYALLLCVWLADYQAYAYFAPLYSGPQLEAALGQAFPMELAAPANVPHRSHLLLPPQQGEFSPTGLPDTKCSPVTTRCSINVAKPSPASMKLVAPNATPCSRRKTARWIC